MFKEFLAFELRLRFKGVSTYAYFFIWLEFSLRCVASESFGPIGNGNGKVLLNGPYAITLNDSHATLFGLFVIAAIFGTSILRDFQRDTYQLLFTKPISKLALAVAGPAVHRNRAHLHRSDDWHVPGHPCALADHSRIGPNHLRWYLQPFLFGVVVQIFFCGSLFVIVAA